METNLHNQKQSDPEALERSMNFGSTPKAIEVAHENIRLDETGFGNVKILQDPAGFCYGADAVMIAAFAAEHCGRRRKPPGRLCDLGTGTGIIPLLLSELTGIGELVGLDVQEDSIRLARRSTALNGLENRLRFLTGNVRDLEKGASLVEELGGEHSFDVVVSNPPYTAGNGGMKSGDDSRMIARHEVAGSLEDFLRGASLLLRSKGDLFLVHRPFRMADVMVSCRENRLEPKTLQLVSGKPGEAPNLMLLHCVKDGGRELRILPPQYTREADGSYSAWMNRNYGNIQQI